jgi:hypothetical protein
MVRKLLRQVVTHDKLPLRLPPTYILLRNMKIENEHGLCETIFSTPMTALTNSTTTVSVESEGTTLWSAIAGFEVEWVGVEFSDSRGIWHGICEPNASVLAVKRSIFLSQRLCIVSRISDQSSFWRHSHYLIEH